MRIRMLLDVNGQAGSLGYKYQAEKQRILSTKVQAVKYVLPPQILPGNIMPQRTLVKAVRHTL